MLFEQNHSEISPFNGKEREELYKRKIQRFNQDFNTLDTLPWEKHPMSPRTAEFVTVLQSRFGEHPRVIDLGSGSGRRTLFLAELGLDMVGIDLAEMGIKKAMRVIQEGMTPIGKVSFIEGDFRRLPFRGWPDIPSFHGFYDHFSLMHLHYKDWSIYFSEAARVTKSGGLGLIVCFTGEDKDFFGINIKGDQIGWLEFQDGKVNLENRLGNESTRSTRTHQYPPYWEGYSWYFASKDEILNVVKDQFRVVNLDLWDYPGSNPEHRGKRYYWNILLERI